MNRQNFTMIAKTLFGFEDILAKELRQLGAQSVKPGVRNVSFVGDLGFMYKANLGLRMAIKILKPIDSFIIANETDLYNKIKRLPWENYLSETGSLAIDSTVHSTVFKHSQYIALKTKDAIVDRFRERTKSRPNVDLKYPDLRINIHIDRERCSVSLDSSGMSLHKRGYRSATNIAPINEVLAAGLVIQSGWDGQSDFFDPMCGSGTILIEAAMIAANVPPNINRKEFAFERWNDWDPDLYENIQQSLLKKIREVPFKIYGFDKAPSAVRKALDNIKEANLEEFVSVTQDDFFKSEKSTEGHLHMLFNPPYGERLEIDAEVFYKKIGDTLKTSYPDSEAWFITSNLEAIKSVGLRPSRKIKVFNAKLEARLLKYEIYTGSKKAKHQDKED